LTHGKHRDEPAGVGDHHLPGILDPRPSHLVSLRPLLLLAALLLLLCSCGEEEPRPVPPDARSPGQKSHPTPETLPPVPFTVRGRLPRPRALRIAFTRSRGPLPPAVFRAAVRRALAVWEATGCVSFEDASSPGQADITFGWEGRRTGTEEGADTGFVAWSGVLAYTGRMGPGCPIRFFSGARFSADGAEGYGLFQAALHEIGHALGLDESPDPEAVMHLAHDARKTELAPADLAGIHSLYGGGENAEGDVLIVPHVETEGHPTPPPLRRVAPLPQDRVALFDADGDGRCELLVWSRDPRKTASLTVFHFDEAFRVVRTTGPRPAIMPLRYESFFARTDDGRSVLIHLLGGRRYDVRVFSSIGYPASRPAPGTPLHLVCGLADADGDGVFDDASPLPPLRDPLLGDINGDGLSDTIRIRGR